MLGYATYSSKPWVLEGIGTLSFAKGLTMMKKIFYALWLLVFSVASHATYDIILENNTPYTLMVNTGCIQDLSDKYYQGWQGKMLAPYGREKVQWFSFNSGIKFGKSYTFYVAAQKVGSAEPASVSFATTIKGFVYGSTIQSIMASSSDGQQSQLFQAEPSPLFSVLKSANFHYLFNDKQDVQLRADAIKYTVPNSHKNVQPTDAISYVISEPQKQYQANDANEKLAIVSYNVQVWPIYAKAGGITLNKPGQRVLDIAQKTQNYDVVTMQEVFDAAHRNTLTHQLASTMPYHTEPAFGNKPLGSGVMIYSRWPIVKSETEVFENCGGIDCGASKGVTYAKLDKNGQMYHVFSTHLQAGSGIKDSAVRMKQVAQIKNFIGRQNIANEEAVIVTGDFNIDAVACNQQGDCAEMNFLLKTLNASYQLHDNHKLLPYTVDGRFNWMSGNNKPAILDHILVLNEHKMPQQRHSRVLVLRGDDDPEMYTGSPYGDTDLSDHFSIEAELTY